MLASQACALLIVAEARCKHNQMVVCRLAALSATMVAAKEPPTFYYNKLCPFAHRAWLAITEKGLDYNPVHIDLKNKPKVRNLPSACHPRSATSTVPRCCSLSLCTRQGEHALHIAGARKPPNHLRYTVLPAHAKVTTRATIGTCVLWSDIDNAGKFAE